MPHPTNAMKHALLPELRSFTITRSRAGDDCREYLLTRPGWRQRIIARDFSPLLAGRQDDSTLLSRLTRSWTALGIHPHLQSCYGPVSPRGAALFLEDIEGESLARLLEDGNLSLRTILSLAIQLCHGVEHLLAAHLPCPPLSPESIIVTPASLIKIRDPVRPLTLSVSHEKKGKKEQDAVAAIGALLAIMLRSGAASDSGGNGGLLTAFVARYAGPVTNDETAARLRRLLNGLYRRIFSADCPYYALSCDFRACHCNNMAVLALVAGRPRQGIALLHQALRLRDRLPEAVANLLLARMQCEGFSPARTTGMIEAAVADGCPTEQLAAVQGIAAAKAAGEANDPPYLLCPPIRSLAIYRQGRTAAANRKLLSQQFRLLRYESCVQTLHSAWQRERFEKNSFLSAIYGRLLARGETRELVGVQRAAVLQAGDGPVRLLRHLPGTKKIVLCCGSGPLRLFHYGRRWESRDLTGSGELFSDLAVAPDGSLIAAITASGTVLFWKANGEKVFAKKVHGEGRAAIGFSGDGRFFASCGTDGRLVTRSVASGNEKIVSLDCRQQVTGLAFVPNLLDLVVSREDGEVEILAARGKKSLSRFRAHDRSVTALTMAASGDFFATAADTIRIWDRRNATCLATLPGPGLDAGSTRLLLVGNGRHLLSAAMDDLIRIHDLVDDRMVAVLDGRDGGITCLARGAKSHFFFAGQQNGAVLVWQLVYNLFFG